MCDHEVQFIMADTVRGMHHVAIILVAPDGKSAIVGDSVASFLNRDRYTVHNVALTELLRSPWEESTKAVVVPSPGGGGPEELDSHEVNRLQGYCEGGGKILSMHPQLNTAFGFPPPSILTAESNPVVVLHCQQLIESNKPFLESSAPLCSVPSIPTDDSPLWEGGSQFTTSTLCTTPPTDTPIIRVLSKTDKSSSSSVTVVLSYADLCPDLRQFTSDPAVLQRLKETHPTREKLLCILLEQLDLQCHSGENPSYSLSYLLTSSPNSRAFADAVRRSGGHAAAGYNVELVERDDCGGIPVDSCPSESKLCILEDPSEGELAGMLFDRRKYFEELKTKCLGRTLLYTPVITSTQTLFEKRQELIALLPDDVRLVSVAGRQTKGKGRHGTVWVSPMGCLMFTLALSIPPSSKLNMCADILCHVPAVAVVHSVRSRCGYEALQLCIKWPNDVYYARKAKVGGILVDLVICEDKTVMLAGVGVNVTNKYPTLSLSDCINMHNAALSSSSQLELISQEHLLAAILNTMEVLVQDLEETLSTRPLEDSLFFKLYYKYWMHNVPFDKVTLAATGQGAIVSGITNKGHLQLQVEGGREVLTLETGGYSFDIFNNIIKVKQPV